MKRLSTLQEIRDLLLEVPEYNVVEWFCVHDYKNFLHIESGLKHADGVTRSPYYYSQVFYGPEHEKRALKDFNEFLEKLNLIDP